MTLTLLLCYWFISFLLGLITAGSARARYLDKRDFGFGSDDDMMGIMFFSCIGLGPIAITMWLVHTMYSKFSDSNGWDHLAAPFRKKTKQKMDLSKHTPEELREMLHALEGKR